MRSKAYIFAALMAALLMVPMAQKAQADAAQSKEYQIKAAFLYQFIKFVDWPDEKNTDSNEPIIIGIIGKDSFGNNINLIKDKKVNNRKLVVKLFQGFDKTNKSEGKDKPRVHKEIVTIRKCHLLFICSSEKENLWEIIKGLEGSDVLTVGDMNGFLESGGIINLIKEEKNIRFEINNTAAIKAGLKIRSQLLRLAKRVISNDKPKGDKQEK